MVVNSLVDGIACLPIMGGFMLQWVERQYP